MSLRFCDSFDHYDTAHMQDKWTQLATNTGINNTLSRTGPQCAAMGSGGGLLNSKTIDYQAGWYIGMAIQLQAYGGSVGVGYTSPGKGQAYILFNGDGTLGAYGGSIGGGTFYANSQAGPNTAMLLNRYYYLEVFFGIAVAGTIIIKLNGLAVLSLTGVQTDFYGSGLADCVALAGPGGGSFMYVDDLYVCDGTGAHNNSFLGDVRVGCIFPASDGAELNYVPSSGTTHYAMVDEAPPASPIPDDDTTYVYDSTPNDRDCYTFQQVDVTRTFLGLQIVITGRKDDAGVREIQGFQRTVNGNYNYGAAVAPNLNYESYIWPSDINPDTGTLWTGAAINSSQFGVLTAA